MNKIVIRYHTHQELTNKNGQTEMSRHLRKRERPHNQKRTTKKPKANTNKRTKIKFRKSKGHMNREKTTLSSLRNIELRIVKMETNKKILPYISSNNIAELNELIYAEEKLVNEKTGIPSKSKKKKIKAMMGNLSGNADKDLRKQEKR